MIERGAGEEVRRTDREPLTREGDDVHYYFPPWLCLLGVRVFLCVRLVSWLALIHTC